MRLEDYERKVFEDVGGLYQKGEEDNTPQDHFTDSLNVHHEISEWRTRDGLSSSIILGYQGNVRRFAFFNDIILILDDNGNLYTYSARAGDTATTPIINVPGAVDFSAIKILGKIFIAFHDGQFGLNGVNLKLFIPDSTIIANDIIRDAAGLAPISATPIVAVDGAGGLVNAGTYKIAVVYITNTGFITQPGPKIAGVFTLTSYVAPGAKKINISNIPTGPAGTSQRQIVITKAGLTEFFFVASAQGGVINDNVATTVTINLDDTTDLVASADYLFDLLEAIPAPLALHVYAGRLFTAGELNNSSILRGSLVGDVESFDQTTGIYFVHKDDGFTIRNLFQMRNTLYIWKNLGTWYVTDNGNDPSEWPEASSFDENVGIPIHGIAEFYNNADVRIARDWTIVADRSGLLLFDGVLRKPQLTNKIGKLWGKINFTYFHKITIVVDDQRHKIYCSIPTSYSTEANTFLCGDYSLCPGKIPESTQIKWSKWDIKPCGSSRRITALGLFNYSPDVVPMLKIGSIDGTGRIYTLDPDVTTDDGQDIESYFESSLLFWEPGHVHTFTALRLRVIGSGTIVNSIRGEDNVNQTSIPSIALSALDFRFFLEIPEGKIDGVNTQFTSCYLTSGGFLLVYQNGLLVTTWTQIATGTIQFTTAPLINDSIQFIYIIDPNSVRTTQFVGEVPTGLINGINTSYTLSNSVPTSEKLYVLGFQNGLLIRNNTDFIVLGNVVTMTVAPLVNDTLYFVYHKDTLQAGWFYEDRGLLGGTTNIFTLSATPSREFVAVFLNGLLLRKFIDYQINGITLILTNQVASNDSLQFFYRLLSSPEGSGSEKLIRYNFQNEKAKVKMDLTAGRFTISKVEYFGSPTYPMRPQ